jgi:peptide-methionine (R)-S-oxide reductase
MESAPDNPATEVRKTDDEWRESLTATQYRVLRHHRTEPPGSHPYNTERRDGQYVCAACGVPI